MSMFSRGAAYDWCAVIRCKHQRSDRGDAGDCADSGLLWGFLGGGRLPHQGWCRHRARMLHSSHGGCAGGSSRAGQVLAGCWWGYRLKLHKYIISSCFCTGICSSWLSLFLCGPLCLGANVHATTATGDTALTYACENGHTDVADVLLQTGADLVSAPAPLFLQLCDNVFDFSSACLPLFYFIFL